MPSVRPVPPRKAGLETSDAVAARLEDMERKIERLRSIYESFFLGVEKRPPHIPRQELNRLMVETQQLSIRNAALRFKFQSLSQRWVLLTTYWNRTMREIESGSYRRDLQKAYRRLAARGEPLTEAEAATLGIPAARAQAFVEQQNRRWGTTAPPPERAPSPALGAGDPMTDGNAARDGASTTATPTMAIAAPATPAAPSKPARGASAGRVDAEELTTLAASLHRAYTDAHAKLALPGAPPTLERLRATLLHRLEHLRADRPGVRLELTVVTDEGRVRIRATPLREP